MSDDGIKPNIEMEEVHELSGSIVDGFVHINKNVKENNMSIEHGQSMKKYHYTNAVFIAVKWSAIAYVTNTSAPKIKGYTDLISSKFDPSDVSNSMAQMLNVIQTNSPDIAQHVALLGAALYVTSIHSKQKEKMINEHHYLQPFKNELLDIMKIDKNEQITDELTSTRLHKFYLIGAHNEGNSIKETIGKIKATIKCLKTLWSDDGLNVFQKLGKTLIFDIKMKDMKTVYSEMRKLSSKNDPINRQYLTKFRNNPNILNSGTARREKLNEFNQEAINTASQTYANQNLQIMFARLVQDILKEDKKEISPLHKKLLEKFEDLHRVTGVKDFFNENEVKSPDDMKRISKMAYDLINNNSHLSKKSSLISIVQSINPNMVIDGKIKYGTFEKHVKEAREKIAGNSNEDYFNLRVHHEQDTLINPTDLEKIASIDIDKARRKMKETKMSSVEKKNKFDELK